MAAVLQGGTATKMITNSVALKIQIINDERLFYQFLDVVNLKAYEIVESEIHYEKNPEVDYSDDDYSPCFYLETDIEKETPHFINEFIKDGYPFVH